MEHWTPTGMEPKDDDDNDSYKTLAFQVAVGGPFLHI